MLVTFWSSQPACWIVHLCFSPHKECGHGGHLVTVYRKHFKCTQIACIDCSSLEVILFKLGGPLPVIIAAIYHPTKPAGFFLMELPEFLSCFKLWQKWVPQSSIPLLFNIYMVLIKAPFSPDGCILATFSFHGGYYVIGVRERRKQQMSFRLGSACCIPCAPPVNSSTAMIGENTFSSRDMTRHYYTMTEHGTFIFSFFEVGCVFAFDTGRT